MVKRYKTYNNGGYIGSDEFTRDLGTTGSLASAGFTVGGPVGAAIGAGTGLFNQAGKAYNRTKFGKSTLGKAAAFLIPGVGIANLIADKKRRKREKLEQQQLQELQEQKLNQFNNLQEIRSKQTLATYPTQGVSGVESFAKGGTLAGNFNIDNNNIKKLSEDLFLFKGNSHENGGISIDTDYDNVTDAEAEGEEVLDIKNNNIYSKRNSPDKDFVSNLKSSTGYNFRGSYAKIAENIGNKLDKLDKLPDNKFSKKTKEVLSERLNSGLNSLFENQELQKEEKVNNKYEAGGNIFSPFGGGGDGEGTGKVKQDKNLTFSYKVLNPDGTYSVISNLPNPGFGSNQQSEINSGIIENNTLPEITNEQIKNVNTVQQIRKLPSMRKVKSNPRFNSKSRKAGNRNFFNRKMYETGGNVVPQKEFIVPENDFDNNSKGNFINNFQNFSDKIPGGLAPQLANLSGYLRNRADINKLDVNLTPTFSQAPRFNYTDRSDYAKSENRVAAQNAIENARLSSSQDNNALNASIIAAKIRGNNQINANESERYDRALDNYNRIGAATDLSNVQTANQFEQLNTNLRNQKVQLKNEARNALIQGILGNIQSQDSKKMDLVRSYLAASQQGDTGVANRLFNDMPKWMKVLVKGR
jgi:hypothetical protein